MGRKWFLAVKKVFGSEAKENHNSEKTKKKWGKSKESRKNLSDPQEDSVVVPSQPSLPKSPPLKQALTNADNGQNQHAYSVAMATAGAAEAAAASARAAGEVARLTTSSSLAVDGRSSMEVAAIKIQAAFRGYLERRGTRTLRGIVRLKLMANRSAVKRQTINTLHSMQTLARVQSQVRERRIRLSEENQALHRQRQLKHEKELEKLKEEDWVDSPHSKEQFEAKLQKKQEAALRRERTLAYAYSHQWRSNSARSKKPAFIDPANQQWGWSWLERWMAARPWESNRTGRIADRDRSSIKSACRSITGDLTKASSRRLSRPASRPSPCSPPSVASNDDICSLLGFQTEQHRRRHSIGGSFCFRDDESRAKSRFQAPLTGKSKANAGSLTRKQLSFSLCSGESKKPMPSAAAARRLSGPPKVATYVKGR